MVQILKCKIPKKFFSLEQYVKGFQGFHAGEDVWPVTRASFYFVTFSCCVTIVVPSLVIASTLTALVL